MITTDDRSYQGGAVHTLMGVQNDVFLEYNQSDHTRPARNRKEDSDVSLRRLHQIDAFIRQKRDCIAVFSQINMKAFLC